MGREVQRWLRPLLLAGGLLAAALAVPAHHAAVAYDRSRTLMLDGTVREFHWGNPHAQLYVSVPAAAGGEEDWIFEGGSVRLMSRFGWDMQTLQPGMKVRVWFAARKDGTHGGVLLRVRREQDGRVFEELVRAQAWPAVAVVAWG